MQPIRIRVNDETFLRSEVLGRKYVYDVMEELYFKISRIDNLPLVLQKKFDKKENWDAIIEEIVSLLRKIGALYRESELTTVGKLSLIHI